MNCRLPADRVYEVVVGKQADEQVPDVNQGGVGTRFIASVWGGTRVSMATPPWDAINLVPMPLLLTKAGFPVTVAKERRKIDSEVNTAGQGV